MSAMTESLLLHAQTLVSTGECSASIDTLRVVIAQCTSDIKNCEEGGEVDVDENARRTSRRMRNVASHLLSTLLLQRAGRRKLERLTMMLGFWKNVCTAKSTIIGDTVTTSSSPFGPNVPYATQKGSWKEDFKPISISKYDLDGIMKSCNAMSNKSISDLVVIDPLWIPIHFGSTVEEEEEKKIRDNAIGKCSFYNGSSSSRFFLQSNSPCEIDNEVLYGIW